MIRLCHALKQAAKASWWIAVPANWVTYFPARQLKL